MSKRFEVRPFDAEVIGAAAELLADRHRRHRLACPALNPAYENPDQCVPLITDLWERDGSLGAVAINDSRVGGYVLMTPRDDSWGANSWAEDAGNAGDPEAIRSCYAHIASELVAAGRRAHWAMVPPSDAELVGAWYSLSFGLQQSYALQRGVGADFQPSARDAVTVRKAEATDVHALAELDLVLPTHTQGSPVFSTRPAPVLEEVEAELATDITNPDYNFWVAEHDGRVVATLVGVDVGVSSAWTPLMKPVRAALLGYAATLPEARGMGAGRALTDTFKVWARDAGYEWLVTDWRTTNLEANRTWRAMGFVPMFDRVHRLIG